MRIRKYAKRANLKFAGPLSSTYVDARHTLIQPHICKLNQSPWDVISFPTDLASSSYQVDQDGCFLDSYRLDKSASPNKMSTIGEEASPENFMPKEGWLDLNVSEKTEHGDGAEGRKDQLGFKKEETVFCSRNDGKGWHCKKPVHKTYSLCKHHLAQFKMYQTSAYRARMKRTVGRKDKIRHNPSAANAPSAADKFAEISVPLD